MIGTNDIGNTFCSPEMVVVGILRVVEEILSRRPNSHVVLNGLLPRTFNQDGFVAKGGKLKPSIWNEIKTINRELKQYATYREKVSFFDTKAFFVDPVALDNELQIDKELMGDFLHPTAEGYQLWGREISETLLQIIPDI
jgi:lysophospholipase L1-like esterase